MNFDKLSSTTNIIRYKAVIGVILYIKKHIQLCCTGAWIMKRKSKHHIYTIVVNKQKKAFIITIVASVITGLTGAKLAENSGNGLYAEISRTSIESHMAPIMPQAEDEPPKIYPKTIFSLCSPVFTEKGDAITVFNAVGEDIENEAYEPPEYEPPAQTESSAEKSIISHNLSITNATNYNINASELESTNLVYDASGADPKVLIVHTHGCETYSDAAGTGLGNNRTYRTTDTEKNMVHIGSILHKQLSDAGIAAIHDKTLCDHPSYNKSYINSMAVIEEYKKNYPSIGFVFDIHRDAITSEDGSPVKLTYSAPDKTKSAQAMIVCGTDAMGLYHPYWKDNLILALKIQKVLETKHPGFMRPVNLRRERFNMHETKGSLIFEIGTHGNTLEEAEKAIKYLADGIVEVIGKKP